MTFDRLGCEENSILLCKNCHTQFDDSANPGFVFLPSDLQYFINFEKDDFETRSQILQEQGYLRRRTCPTAERYEQHLRDTQQLMGGVDLGGLYHIYILRRYFGKHGNKPWMPGRDPTGPKQWHGAPMAAIRRGISALGSMICQIPQQERNQLRELQDLYSHQPGGASPRVTLVNDEGPSTNVLATSNEAIDTNFGTSGSPLHPPQLLPATRQPPNTLSQTHGGEFRRCHDDSAVDVQSVQGNKNAEGHAYCADWSYKKSGDTRNVHQHSRRSTKRKRELMLEEVADHRWRWGPSSSSNDKAVLGMKIEDDSNVDEQSR